MEAQFGDSDPDISGEVFQLETSKFERSRKTPPDHHGDHLYNLLQTGTCVKSLKNLKISTVTKRQDSDFRKFGSLPKSRWFREWCHRNVLFKSWTFQRQKIVHCFLQHPHAHFSHVPCPHHYVHHEETTTSSNQKEARAQLGYNCPNIELWRFASSENSYQFNTRKFGWK